MYGGPHGTAAQWRPAFCGKSHAIANRKSDAYTGSDSDADEAASYETQRKYCE